MLQEVGRADRTAATVGADRGAGASGKQIAALDGLRGVAVLLVIASHANLAFGGPFATGATAGPLASILSGGWIGVDLFFVLSGFLITGILWNSRSDSHYFRNFYARRALRIFPLYYLYVFGLLALSHAFPGILGVTPLPDAQALSLIGYFYNFYAALAPDGFARGYHFFWSLAVEEHFYLVWPVIVLRLPASTIMRICFYGLVASLGLRIAVIASGAWLQVAYLVTPCRLDGLLAGSFMALAIADPVWRARLQRYCAPAALVCAGLLTGLLLGQRHFSDKVDFRYEHGPAVDSTMVLTVGLSAVAILFAALLFLLLGLAPDARVRRELERNWLVSVGRYSYGMYIIHSLLLRTFLYFAYSGDATLSELPDIVAKPALALAVAGSSYVLSYFIYDAFERRFLDLKKYFQAVPKAPASIGATTARAA